jgi:hypothetical protein
MEKPPMQNLDYQEVQLREYREAEARAYQENPVMAVAPPGPPQYYPQPYPPQNPPVVYANPYPVPTPYPPAPYPGQPYPVPYAGRDYPPGQPFQNGAIVNMMQPQMMIVPIQEPQGLPEETNKLFRMSRILKFAALGNFLVDILFTMTVPALILLFLLNIIGYLAARRVNRILGVIYCVYLALIIVLRIALMAIFPYPYVIIIYVLVCIFEVLLLAGFVVFIVRISRIGEIGRQQIISHAMMLQANSRCCFI